MSIGFVVNPIAGLGGRVGLHGTDGAALDAARSRGASAVAPHRARRALARLRALCPDVPVLTVAGAMGGDVVGAGADMLADPGPVTSADDTRRAAAAMARAGVTLILFAGGDGTARDVVDTVGTTVPVLGVPSGVKMHSGVFAVGPEAAGETAARFLADPVRLGTVVAEVLEEDALLAVARVPNAPRQVQRAKAAGPASDEADLAALGRDIAGSMAPGRLYLLGPGTTVAHVSAALGVPATLSGVDAVRDGQLAGADLAEHDLLALLRGDQATLLLGVVGGQGFLLGRGNQQLSPAVLAAVDDIEILAARGKVAALDPPVLHVDIGDERSESALAGYHRVRTGPGQSTVLRVVEGT